MEKYVEDVKQKQKDVPDLVESIMRPTDPAKGEIRRILFKMSQYRSEIIKIRVSTFGTSGKSTDSRRRPKQPSGSVSFKPTTAFQTVKNQKNGKGHYPSCVCLPGQFADPAKRNVPRGFIADDCVRR